MTKKKANRTSRRPASIITIIEGPLAQGLGWLEVEYAATRDPKVLKAIRTLDPTWREEGRPVGTGIDDRACLTRMADLMAAGEAQSVLAAAKTVAADHPGQSVESTIDRLERKFRKEKEALLQAARQRREKVQSRPHQEQPPPFSDTFPEVGAAGAASTPSPPIRSYRTDGSESDDI